MSENVYKKLREAMARRGGMYPVKDIPEFYVMAEELFTPKEAEVQTAMPRGPFTAAMIAQAMGKAEGEVAVILEQIAEKGHCASILREGQRYYMSLQFVPGIFEMIFMKGSKTDEAKKQAKLIHDFKAALEKDMGPAELTFASVRAIPVDRTIQAGNVIHTYSQVATYIEKYEPIAVGTCYCRHEAELVDENNVCDKPNDVCMQFGVGAENLIERGISREISKKEAMEVLDRAEDAGLVHLTRNMQEIDFICNCCACHCEPMGEALKQEKPARFFTSGYLPEFDVSVCTACEICVDRCPGAALEMGAENIPVVDLDRCFGCGVCATGCAFEAVELIAKPDAAPVPANKKELKEIAIASMS